jgi:hypothetical protein
VIYSNEFQLLAQATVSGAVQSTGFRFAEYRTGIMIVHLLTLAATTRVYPVWQLAIGATGPGSGRYVTLRAFATALKTVTGLSIMTLPDVMLGGWHRVGITLGGTNPASKLRIVAIMKGQQ